MGYLSNHATRFANTIWEACKVCVFHAVDKRSAAEVSQGTLPCRYEPFTLRALFVLLFHSRISVTMRL